MGWFAQRVNGGQIVEMLQAKLVLTGGTRSQVALFHTRACASESVVHIIQPSKGTWAKPFKSHHSNVKCKCIRFAYSLSMHDMFATVYTQHCNTYPAFTYSIIILNVS